MKRAKKLALSAAALTVVGGIGAAGVSTAVNAQSNEDKPSSSLVDKLASKFNLNKDDVQKVFDENRSEMEAKHEANNKARLDQAVKDGKITQEQEDKIIAKQKELKAEREANKDAFKSKTETERKAAMDAKKAELEKWAKDNNIPLEYLNPGGGRGMGGPPPQQ